MYKRQEPIIGVLYSSLRGTPELLIAGQMMKVLSIGLFFMTLVQTSNGILQGMGRPNIPVISMLCGGIVKIIVSFIPVSYTHLKTDAGGGNAVDFADTIFHLGGAVGAVQILETVGFLHGNGSP